MTREPVQPRGRRLAGEAARHARRIAKPVSATSARLSAPVVKAYRASTQLRVVTATLAASMILVVVFGFVVAGSITGGMVNTRVDGAIEEVEAARESASEELASVVSRDDPTLENRLSAQAEEHVGDVDGSESPTVLLRLPGEPAVAESRPSVPDVVEPTIPRDLQASVADGYLSTKFDHVNPDGKGEREFLVVGTPVYTEQLSYELYFLFPMDDEVEAINLVRNTLVIAGITLVLLLGVIAWLVTRMVVAPVRAAARTAQRLSAGLLHERMSVTGADDLARLAGSFNLMAENLHQQIVRLEDMSRLQRRFTSDVSHELRTPLTTVRMAADVLYEAKEDFPAPTARSAELLYDELNRFEELLGDLLEISRFDAGFAALDVEAVELGSIVDSVVNSLAGLADKCGVEIRKHLPEEPVIAEIDARRVQRVLRNLVANALEHAEGEPVCVILDSSESAAALAVRDRGVGLKPGEEKLVFNRFWRADPSRARQTGGTGLGLSISAEDAKLHNGMLDAMGQPRGGAVFRLSLPLHAGDKVLVSPLPLDYSADPCGAEDAEAE
ncbi:MAG: MtrAB system histidine kinase MtrB [Stackebrandtia sp.]